MSKVIVSNRTLGMGTGIGIGLAGYYRPKMWVATAIGAGVGLASSLIGGMQASKAARDAERRQRAREAEAQAWYNRRYNENYVDTAAGQNLVRRAKEYARTQWRKAAGAQAVAGGTDAATAMAKEAGNRMVGDTIANIASTDQTRKAQVDSTYNTMRGQFAQQDMQRDVARAQSITDAAGNASNALLMAGALVDGANLKGSKN